MILFCFLGISVVNIVLEKHWWLLLVVGSMDEEARLE